MIFKKRLIQLYILLSLLFSAYSHATSPHKKIIYLSFDDGPINNTVHIIDVLDQNHIKATFFINGWHLFGKGGEKEDKAVDSLIALLKHGEIVANHSYEHMMGYQHCEKNKISNDPNFYNFYCSELSLRTYSNPKIDYLFFNPLNITKIRKIIYSQKNAPIKYSNDHLDDMARLPFTNNWRVKNNTSSLIGNAPCATTDHKPLVDFTPNDFHLCLKTPTQSAQNGFKLADLLAKNGFQVYGWDIAWSPQDWRTTTLSNAEKLATETENAFNHCIPHTTPLFQDRAPDLNCNAPLHTNKVIILMHDFLFENGSRGNGEVNLVELDKYIKMMQKKGYGFDTLDHYRGK